eukprot:1520347-Pleurochrysis_carterae.AAC.1
MPDAHSLKREERVKLDLPLPSSLYNFQHAMLPGEAVGHVSVEITAAQGGFNNNFSAGPQNFEFPQND